MAGDNYTHKRKKKQQKAQNLTGLKSLECEMIALCVITAAAAVVAVVFMQSVSETVMASDAAVTFRGQTSGAQT